MRYIGGGIGHLDPAQAPTSSDQAFEDLRHAVEQEDLDLAMEDGPEVDSTDDADLDEPQDDEGEGEGEGEDNAAKTRERHADETDSEGEDYDSGDDSHSDGGEVGAGVDD